MGVHNGRGPTWCPTAAVTEATQGGWADSAPGTMGQDQQRVPHGPRAVPYTDGKRKPKGTCLPTAPGKPTFLPSSKGMSEEPGQAPLFSGMHALRSRSGAGLQACPS